MIDVKKFTLQDESPETKEETPTEESSTEEAPVEGGSEEKSE